mmetsp:Transcript_78736/g.228572  ORF Transcript_78736/g.228572 Transcript_78736/m.228572 type:complete len:396 (-) Transcript_78736:76-1263(-)
MAKCAAMTVAIAAAWVYPLTVRMPPPYDGRVAQDIEAERLELLPGAARGAPAPANLTGPYAVNSRLQKAHRVFVGEVDGSESVAVAPSGELIMLDKYGVMHRARPSAAAPGGFELLRDAAPVYIGPGRPLGFHVVEGGEALLVCDSLKGLLRVGITDGRIEVLANRVTATGDPLNYANDLDVAADGTVYFTSSTAGAVGLNAAGFYDTMRSYLFNMLAGDATGRLLSWNPATREVVQLLDGIAYANGVAVSADGSFVAVVETNLCRVRRYWLRGPKKGTYDILVDKLPGVPDGITRSASGGFWVTLPIAVTPLINFLGPRRMLRQIVSHFIVQVLPYVTRAWGCVVRLDAEGKPLENLMDSTGEVVSTVSAVTETPDGRLFLGNLGGTGVSWISP